MAYFFHANEIAKTAVEIERKGRAFYLRLEQEAKGEKTRELFGYLAAEEARHEQIFAALFERLGNVELPAWATREEYTAYIQGLIESHALFSDDMVTKRMAVIEDEREAVIMAMGFEKDTLLFFAEMESLVPESERQAIRDCMDEERVHLSRLQKILKEI
ncbi:Rubrerythrin [Pseudodesulfovibrio hydrargyri]|uniref:Rubrerythrin n=1 Tax=Pseudodesulfovibrio hydrargyri TaxID=2125990 RepID=A0A1J5NFL2_9BACT|nr:ferritin family protein [Pseudodesulfovibrio hydrargyri]OIQ50505.1 Rubrerythrin [Pseudodesulfovibrio hydrargyri]